MKEFERRIKKILEDELKITDTKKRDKIAKKIISALFESVSDDANKDNVVELFEIKSVREFVRHPNASLTVPTIVMKRNTPIGYYVPFTFFKKLSKSSVFGCVMRMLNVIMLHIGMTKTLKSMGCCNESEERE